MKNFFTIAFSFKIIFLLFLTINQISTKCSQGCLRCDKISNECLFCDFENFYYFDLNSELCKKHTLSSCEIAFTKNNCLLCSDNKYPGPQGNCISVESTNIVQNCQYYYLGSKCAICKPGYAFNSDNTQCILVENIIVDCAVHSLDKCLVCKQGSHLDKSFKCVKSETNQFCTSTNVNFACNDGICDDFRFVDINLNNILQQSFNSNNENLLRKIFRLSSLKKRNLLFDSEFIRNYLNTERVISNPSTNIVYTNYSQLDQTLNPFESEMMRKTRFASNQPISIKPIDFSLVQFLFPYCLSLNSKTLTCETCIDGYALDINSNRCLEIFKINSVDICIVYETFGRCVQCQIGYSVDENGVCQKLQDSNDVLLIKLDEKDLNEQIQGDNSFLPLIDTMPVVIPTNIDGENVIVVPEIDNNENVIVVPEVDNNNNTTVIVPEVNNNESVVVVPEAENNNESVVVVPEAENSNENTIIFVPGFENTNNNTTVVPETENNNDNTTVVPEVEDKNTSNTNNNTITIPENTIIDNTDESTTPTESNITTNIEGTNNTTIDNINDDLLPLNETTINNSDNNNIVINNETNTFPPIEINEELQPLPEEIAEEQTETIPEEEQTGPTNSTTTEFSELLEQLEQIPEEEIQPSGISLIDSSSTTLPFRNNRVYSFRRRYRNLSDEEQEPIETDYGVLLRDSQVFLMETEENKIKRNIILSENCEILQIETETEIPSCLKCSNQNEYILTPISSRETNILHCKNRTREIINCNSYIPKEEKCQSCINNYFLWTSETTQLCIKEIEGCEQNIFEEGILKCSKCVPDYFLESNICFKENEPIINCDIQEKNICVTCKEGFLKFNNLCIAELAFSFFFCPINSNNDCICGDNALEIQNIDECLPIKNDNCIQYNSSNTCIKCKNKFYLNSINECVQGEIEFCREYAVISNQGTQSCLFCDDTYVLENNTCRPSLSYFTNNCNESRGEFCLQCKENYFNIDLSINPKPLDLCLPRQFESSYPSSKNCLIFNSITKACELCIEGLYIDSNGNCNECNLLINGIDNFNTSCVTPDTLINGCELYDENFCVKCQNETLPAIYDSELFTASQRIYTNRTKNIFVQKPNFVINECEVNLNETCMTNNCKSAINLQSGSICCSQCTKGRTGVWNQENEMFYTSNCDTLVEFCDLSSNIKGIPMEYLRFLTCEKCIDNKIVQLNLTEGLTQVECIDIPQDQPELTNCLVKIESSCRICQPGYLPISSGNGDILCQEIADCEFSETIDKCDKCNTNFSLNINSNGCIPSPIPNCKKIDDQLKCIECNDSMILKNNQCISIKQNSCLRYDSDNCLECNQSDSFILYKMNFSQISSFTDNKKSICSSPLNSPWITTSTNCELFSSPKFCIKCKSGYILQEITDNERICNDIQSFTENCNLINSNNNCIKCIDGYYLEGDRCFKGNIKHCKEYSDISVCEICENNYEPIPIQGNTFCYLSHSIPNCEKTILTKNNNNISISCDLCQSSFYPKQINTSEKLCFPLRNQKNCRMVDSETSQCLQCDDFFYLNQDLQCIKRENINIPQCLILQPNGDSCFQCDNNYILSPDGLSCILRESFLLPECELQLPNSDLCIKCRSGYFLNNNKKCQTVTKPVANCEEHLNETLCKKCQFGYLLFDGMFSDKCVPEMQVSVSVNAETINISDVEVIAMSERILQDDKISLVDPTKMIDESVDNIADKITNQVLGENSNSIIKDVVKTQVESSINKEIAPATDSINNIKDRLNNLSENVQDSLKKELENIDPNSIIDLKTNEQPTDLSQESENNKENNNEETSKENKNNDENSIDIKGIRCGLCQEGYSYSEISKICTKNTEEGCIMMKINSNSANECEMCISGYFQIDNGSCIKNKSTNILYTLISLLLVTLLSI